MVHPHDHPLNLQGPVTECRIFSKRAKTWSTPLVCRSCSPMRNSLCGSLCWSPTPCSVSSSLGLFQGSCGGRLGYSVPQSPSLPREMLIFALLAHSSSGPSVLRPQGSQTPSSIHTNPDRTEDCRSWKNSFLAESKFSCKCQGGGGVKMIHKFKHIFWIVLA